MSERMDSLDERESRERKEEMKVFLGETGLDKSWQEPFPPETRCSCGAMARIAFVAYEDKEKDYVCRHHENEGEGGYWPHDAIATATYFCRRCFKPITLWNQA